MTGAQSHHFKPKGTEKMLDGDEAGGQLRGFRWDDDHVRGKHNPNKKGTECISIDGDT